MGLVHFQPQMQGKSMGGPTFASGRCDSSGAIAHLPNSFSQLYQTHYSNPCPFNNPSFWSSHQKWAWHCQSTNTYCPVEHYDVIHMMKWHFCAHPLIPRYATPTPERIKTWAVKQTWVLCPTQLVKPLCLHMGELVRTSMEGRSCGHAVVIPMRYHT